MNWDDASIQWDQALIQWDASSTAGDPNPVLFTYRETGHTTTYRERA